MIYYQVMRNAGKPSPELAALDITPLFNGNDSLNESLLKYIFSELPVFYYKKNVVVNAIGRDGLQHIFDLTDVYHSENMDKLTFEFTEKSDAFKSSITSVFDVLAPNIPSLKLPVMREFMRRTSRL